MFIYIYIHYGIFMTKKMYYNNANKNNVNHIFDSKMFAMLVIQY